MGARPPTASSAAKGSRKNASVFAPESTSLDQVSESPASTKNAAAGMEMT
jgi:hypothetical protein